MSSVIIDDKVAAFEISYGFDLAKTPRKTSGIWKINSPDHIAYHILLAKISMICYYPRTHKLILFCFVSAEAYWFQATYDYLWKHWAVHINKNIVKSSIKRAPIESH